jgi:hypothetical protein
MWKLLAPGVGLVDVLTPDMDAIRLYNTYTSDNVCVDLRLYNTYTSDNVCVDLYN